MINAAKMMHMAMQLLCLFVILQLCVERFGAYLDAIKNDKRCQCSFCPKSQRLAAAQASNQLYSSVNDACDLSLG